MTYKLMATSRASHDVKFRNRAADELNDATLNPVKVPNGQLAIKVQDARQAMHEQLVDRFDTNVPLPTKKFYFIAALLDPRFKKLTFKHDDMLSDVRRRQAIKWLKEEFEAKYKGKFKAKDAAAAGPGPVGASSPAGEQQHRKRRKFSAASFFAESEDDDDEGEEEAAAPIKDELKEYLALPQIKYKSEQDAML